MRKHSVYTVGKGENTVFSTLSKREIVIIATSNFSSANAFNLVTSKILLFGKELPQTATFRLFQTERVCRQF